MVKAVESEEREFAEQEQIVEKVISNRWLFPVFQPVVSLSDGGITGYEALTRMKQESGCTEKMSIEQLFYCAEVSGQIWKLDYLCRKNAIRQFYESSEAKCGKRLFLNVCPSIMLDRRFKAGFTKEYLERYKADPDSIVFEITERKAVRDSEEFKELVNHYKKQGFKTAIDDVGAGYSGLKRIVDVVPQFIKLDISLIRDIHLNPVSAAIVKSMTAFANENGIRLIAEGIETREEQEMENCIKTGEVYSVYYLDLDNFKANNDIYGFENRDKIICALAETLCEVVNREGFVGHIGGDDFVLIVQGEYPAGNIRRIEEKFAEKIRPLYSEADLKRGYIEAVNRQGEYDRFPIVSVTTVGITNKSRKYNSQYEMSEELALLKKKEKRLKQEHFRKELA